MDLVLMLTLLVSAPASQQTQAAKRWDPLQFLVGDWEGEGSGEPGRGAGGFSFAFELEKNILVRHNHADYPATQEHPAFSHRDLMIIYPGDNKGEFRALYFDNEGHVIHYTTTVSKDGKTVQFISPPVPGSPRFRLTYVNQGKGTLTIKFEMAPPDQPDGFSIYLEASARQVAGP